MKIGNQYKWEGEEEPFTIIDIVEKTCTYQYPNGNISTLWIKNIEANCILILEKEQTPLEKLQEAMKVEVKSIVKSKGLFKIIFYGIFPYFMKKEQSEQISKMAEALADPRITVADLENYRAKAKIMIETIEMAQDAERRQINKMVGNIISGKL